MCWEIAITCTSRKKEKMANECEVCNTSRRRVLQSHKLTIACSPRVKHVIFPNKFSDNCTFTVCFETGKWLYSPRVRKIASCEDSHFHVSKQTMNVQFSLDVLGKCFFCVAHDFFFTGGSKNAFGCPARRNKLHFMTR